MPLQFEFIVTAEQREVDAEDAIEQLCARHGIALEGEYPRFRAIRADANADTGEAAVGLLDAWLTDLVYAPPIRSVALSIGEQDGAASGQVTVMRIDEFLALSRCTGIVNGRWYRVHAPAGYSCRPR